MYDRKSEHEGSECKDGAEKSQLRGKLRRDEILYTCLYELF
jgi:hypothetical protein